MVYFFPQRTHLLPLFPIISTPSSALISSKLKRLIQTLIFSHLLQISHTLIKAKTLVFQGIKNIHFIDFSMKKKKKNNGIFMGSFRLHYNFCSSHIWLEPIPMDEGFFFFSDVSSLNTHFSTDSCEDDYEDERLSGYLNWLEGISGSRNEEDSGNEIDRLADMFIAESHMKFKVDKVESDRRFQEMLARSV